MQHAYYGFLYLVIHRRGLRLRYQAYTIRTCNNSLFGFSGFPSIEHANEDKWRKNSLKTLRQLMMYNDLSTETQLHYLQSREHCPLHQAHIHRLRSSESSASSASCERTDWIWLDMLSLLWAGQLWSGCSSRPARWEYEYESSMTQSSRWTSWRSPPPAWLARLSMLSLGVGRGSSSHVRPKPRVYSMKQARAQDSKQKWFECRLIASKSKKFHETTISV